MLSLANYPYSRQEIIDALHGKHGNRQIRFRYDLLDKNDNKIKELDSVVDGEVSMASLSSIKRTARFKIKDKGDINWLTDRIQPFVELKMPEKVVDAKVLPTFSRSSAAYKQDGTQVASGQPRYGHGRFGRGIMIEEGTTNLFSNPKFQNNASGWSSNGSTIRVLYENGVAILQKDSNSEWIGYYQTFNNLTAGVTYTITYRVKHKSGSTKFGGHTGPAASGSGGSIKIRIDGGAWLNGNIIDVPSDGKYHTVELQMVPGSAYTDKTIYVQPGRGDSVASEFYVDYVQLEQKPYATSFVNGTRSAETLTIPTAGVLNASEGTIEVLVNVNSMIKNTSANRYVFAFSTNPNGNYANTIALRHDMNNKWELWTVDSFGSQSIAGVNDTLAEGWHLFTCRWNNKEIALFIDGVKQATVSNPKIPSSLATNLYIGVWANGLYGWINTIIDDLRISSRARSDEEILAAYQSNSPLPVDKDTTYKLNFDGNLNAKTYQPSQWIEFPLGIFLLSSPTRKDENNSVYRDVEAYDGLLILRDDKFDTRYTIPAGTNYRQAVIDILTSAGITKHNIEQTDKVLPVDMEFEPGTEKLEAINALLQAINYTPLYVDVYGYFTSMTYRSPSIRSAEYTYRDDELSIVYPGMEEELDLFNVPNKWVVVCSNAEQSLMSSYTNSNPDSPTSTINRGRTIVDYREVTDIADQQSLDAYVQRIAFEASQVYGKLTFETALNPLHDYMDVLEIDYSPLGIKGKYSETGWTMPLKAGARMKHEVRKVVSI